uniref:Homing endonuclease LAGLIDADG domain-containing protein n=1 Tax=Orbilia brochopaga TaxID=3140254 RepID=A0A4Y5MV61_9PEZI|nr:hypothetical protein [Drechslerella brochopaga]
MLHPLYVTGFSDAESTFVVKISKDPRTKTGWRIDPVFEIGLNEKELALLEKIQSFFAVGTIRKNKVNNSVIFAVQSVKDLTTVIIPHFDKFPLITQKRADYELFKQVVTILARKQHLSLSGLQEVVNLRASINNGLTEKLKEYFPDTKPAHKPIVDLISIFDSNWLAGFVDGEGNFLIAIVTNDKTKMGCTVSLRFSVCQHNRDAKLMENLINFLGCGSVVYHNVRSTVEFVVTKFTDIEKKVIPFFEKYPLEGIKSLNFYSFIKAFELMKNKAHLNPEGLKKILQIKEKMNKR